MSAGAGAGVGVVEKERGLTVEAAATRLGCSSVRIYQLLRQGQLQARREGGRWLINEAGVAALLARRVEEARAHYERLSLLTLVEK